MKDEERVRLIRKGNELFNSGNMNEAVKIFVQTGYRDGITRVADHYYFELKQPLIALKFYRMVKRQDRVDEIFERMKFALNKMLRGSDEPETAPDEEIDVKIHPKLKILAEEILRDNNEES